MECCLAVEVFLIDLARSHPCYQVDDCKLTVFLDCPVQGCRTVIVLDTQTHLLKEAEKEATDWLVKNRAKMKGI